jgi:predicted amidohydrolase
MSALNLPSPYRVASIQYNPIFGEKEKNVSKLSSLVEEAALQGARLIVLPEMATTGYCWVSREEIAPYVETIPGPTTQRFQALASAYHCYIALGLPEVDAHTNVYYNCLVLLGPDGLVGSYRKIHSYIAEPRWARDGDLGMPVWETELGRLSALICMDAAYFEAARIPALHGADVLLLATNWDNERCPHSWWMARAFENEVFVIAANRSDSERGVQFGGGSCVINPDGSLQSYVDVEEGIVYGEVDLRARNPKYWGEETRRFARRRPATYIDLVANTYLWEPLRYHSLYDLGELPAGQLSCTGIMQLDLSQLPPASSSLEAAQNLRQLIFMQVNDNAPARPDVLVLPELVLPGLLTQSLAAEDPQALQTSIQSHFQQHSIQIPGPETALLTALADELQISMVLGVAEQANGHYYNSVLLIDPEGVYGRYRKIHLSALDQLWADPGDLGLPTFDTPSGRIGLLTGYDVLFPETLRVLAGKGVDLVCAPALLDFPAAYGLPPSKIIHARPAGPDEYDPLHFLIWRVRAAEHNVYLALANWQGDGGPFSANGLSGIFSPSHGQYPWPEVVAEAGETGLMMMTIDTREQRTGQRTSQRISYSLGEISGSLTGELAYSSHETFPGNAVRGKPFLRRRQPYWYLDLLREDL